jgi:hypothetical protein
VEEKRQRSIYVPRITGEFATEDQILARAQEYFLIVVQKVTPGPLYALRERVLPRYREAFYFEKGRGQSDHEIQALSVRGMIDVVLSDEIADLKSLPAFQAEWATSQRMYDASAELVAWCKRFNLTGRREDLTEPADPSVLRSRRRDAIWPLVAALETILHWHFAPAGRLWERQNPPSWRPPERLFREAPFPLETLPPIRLKSVAVWQPTTAKDSAEVNALHEDARQRLLEAYSGDGVDCSAAATQIVEDLRLKMKRYPETSVIDTPDWAIQLETEAQFRVSFRQACVRPASRAC